jgi:exopolysaccharide biosynthesis polyprenyl glycosylphosphotransferase
MLRRFSANFAVFSIFLDAILIDFALGLATILRAPLNMLSFVEPMPYPVRLPAVLFTIFPVLWIGVLLLFSVYDGRQNLRWADEFGSLTLGSMLAAISMAGVLYLSYRDVSRFLFLFFVIMGYGFLLLWRVIIRYFFRRRRLYGLQHRLVLILGAGRVGRGLLKQIIGQPDVGIRIFGYLDDDPDKQARGLDILGSLDKTRELVIENNVDDVIVALPQSAFSRLNEVVSGLYDLPVRVWVIPDYFALTLHQASVEEFAGLPMLNLRAPAISEYQRMVKRGFDLICTLSAMPILLPVIAMIAAAIKLDSPGPVFYRQKRVGENGCIFEMIKFRTMVANADALRQQVETVNQDGQLIHKQRNDPRVTRVGKILRRTSMDELPQLFNVLKGEMTLVGPRPEMPYLVEKYDLWQRKRFAVPQGMTGWWQIHGRSDRPMHLNTEDDLFYVQNYTLWLDLKILVKTFWVVVKGKGAY